MVRANRFVLAAVALGAIGTACSRAPATTTISVVGTNDLHGGILARNGRGGVALLGGHLTNLRAARARDGGAVLVFDAGDMFQGTLESNLTEGAPVIAAYNALGYNAVTIGNHDFDYGPVGEQATPVNPDEDPRGALKARAADARFPFLAANILDTGTNEPVDWPNVKPSTMLDVNGIKVGVVGLTTLETLQATISMNTWGLAIGPLERALATEAAKLRATGATIVIGVAHAGGSCRAVENANDLSSCGQKDEILEVARAVPPGAVDVIVAGHRHDVIAHEVAGVGIIESRSSGRAFGRVDLTVDRKSGRVQSRRIFPPQEICAEEDASSQCVDEGSAGSRARQYEGLPVVPDATVANIVAAAEQGARARKETPLNVEVEADIRRSEDRRSPLGDLLVDRMVQWFGPADVAIYNTGGLRADLPAGPLTYGRLYEVFPFDNRVARLTVSGDELRRVVENNLSQRGSLLLLGGARAVADCAGSTLRVRLRRASGAQILPTDQLRVVTVDFLATGGDGFFDSIQPVKLIGSVSDGPIFRDVFAFSLMRSGGTLRPPSSSSPRGLVFDGPRPVTCPASTR
ncbi:MAG: bifunctional metallophosphatase/5'-nucleotidase [Vicinamibacterales bacterium]